MLRAVLILPILLLAGASPAAAPDQPPVPATPPADPQIELNLVSLPTTRSIGRHKSYTRFTHRFARDMQEGRQPAAGVVTSFTRGQSLALYASPVFVNGTREAEVLGGGSHDHDHLATADVPEHAQEGDEHADHEGTFFLGLGGRLRVLPSVFLAGEISPPLAGHDPGDAGWGVSIEKWTRGHTLALTLTNFFGNTPGQIARGGTGALYLGFNITRKF